jgi:hypothetical protein
MRIVRLGVAVVVEGDIAQDAVMKDLSHVLHSPNATEFNGEIQWAGCEVYRLRPTRTGKKEEEPFAQAAE